MPRQRLSEPDLPVKGHGAGRASRYGPHSAKSAVHERRAGEDEADAETGVLKDLHVPEMEKWARLLQNGGITSPSGHANSGNTLQYGVACRQLFCHSCCVYGHACDEFHCKLYATNRTHESRTCYTQPTCQAWCFSLDQADEHQTWFAVCTVL